MALLFMDGFGLYAGSTSAFKRWSFAPTLTPSPSYGRFGGNGMRLESSTVYLRKNLGLASKTQLVLGFAFDYYSAITPVYNASYPFIQFLDDSGVVQVKIHVTYFSFHLDHFLQGTSSNELMFYIFSLSLRQDTHFYQKCVHDI